MKPLSQSEYGEIRDLYASVYAPTETIEEELVHEICDELIEELITEGYSEEDAIDIVEDATNDYIDEAKVTFGSDTAPMRKSGAPVGARRRFAMRRAGDAVKKAGDAAKGAVDSAKRKASVAKAGVQIAGSIAKDEAKRAKRKAALAVTTAPEKAKAAASDAKKKAKSGIKGFIKRQAQKVVSRMSEENVEELYKGKHGQTEKQYQDSRSDAGKMVSGDSKMSGAAYSSRSMKGTGPNPAGGSKKPAGQGRMTSGARTDLQFRKAAMKKEELEATGLFSEKEIAAIEEAMSSYDRNRKRAAERAAARNAARDAGKTGAVPGVGYVTPRRERETYVDSAGTTRHKSGAKMPKD
tara:strand:- start:1457 stop:2512 length:1056 start_codon:yes stop_codon:yes gene_type:complete